MSLEAGNQARGWDLSLEGVDGGGEEEGEGEGEGKICPMCESIGHWPLRGRCPKNKDIRPKSPVSALSKKVRLTDRQTILFSKKFEILSRQKKSFVQ